jgi:O-antigen/teichoic acid export membrane protein
MSTRSASVLLENILANYAYVVVMGVVTLVATPVYVHRLGPTQWGLVALCMTAQGLLLVLDAGLGQIMPREIARAARNGRAVEAYRASLKLYGGVALGAVLLGQFFMPALADALVHGDAGLQPELHTVLRLVLIQFLFQFPNNAAVAYWNGTEQQRAANLRQAGFAAAKHGLALSLVTLWQPSAVAYMLPFVAVSAIEWAVNARRICTAPRDEPLAGSPVPSVRHLVASASGFSAAVIVGMLTSQIDRLYLARSVPAAVFGSYVVAANLALTLMHLQGPVQRAFLPRIVAAGEPPLRLVGQMLGLIALVGLLPCVALALVAEPLLRLWLHSPEMARLGAPVFSLIAVAVGLNGLYGGVYTLFIRDNLFGRLIVLNVVILLVQLLILTVFTDRYSIVAGGLCWLFCSIAQVLFGAVAMIHLWRRRHAG